MKRKFHVRFLGGGGLVTVCCYPILVNGQIRRSAGSYETQV